MKEQNLVKVDGSKSSPWNGRNKRRNRENLCLLLLLTADILEDPDGMADDEREELIGLLRDAEFDLKSK